MSEPADEAVEAVAILICTACIDGVGEECHTPGCALFLHSVSLPIHRELLKPLADVEKDAITAYLATPEMVALRKDAERLDELERMANQPGGILLHDGSECGRRGLGLRPGAVARTLRQAIDAAMAREEGNG